MIQSGKLADCIEQQHAGQWQRGFGVGLHLCSPQMMDASLGEFARNLSEARRLPWRENQE
jgi:hypothetical protein